MMGTEKSLISGILAKLDRKHHTMEKGLEGYTQVKFSSTILMTQFKRINKAVKHLKLQLRLLHTLRKLPSHSYETNFEQC